MRHIGTDNGRYVNSAGLIVVPGGYPALTRVASYDLLPLPGEPPCKGFHGSVVARASADVAVRQHPLSRWPRPCRRGCAAGRLCVE
jgi:hypothetical protein